MEFNWAYIFHAPETNPVTDRLVIHRANCRSTLVGVPDMAAAIKVAQELAEAGAKSIEVCGYFGPIGATEIHKAVQGKVAVGCVMFGAESIVNAYRAFIPPGT